MCKKILKIIYLFGLLNIVKAAEDPKKELEDVIIEADKIIITDVTTNKDYKTTEKRGINIGKQGVNKANIYLNRELFKCDENSFQDDVKVYDVIEIFQGSKKIIDSTVVDKNKELYINICPIIYLSKKIIKIKIDDNEYENVEIDKLLNDKNYNDFFICKDKKSVIEFLLNIIKYKNKTVDKKLNIDSLDKYYIKLSILTDKELEDFDDINEEQVEKIKDNIKNNRRIEISLITRKNKVNLNYKDQNLKENIKKILEEIKNGKINKKSTCKNIIEALKKEYIQGIYTIKKNGSNDDLSNDDTDITNETIKYDLTLSDNCYDLAVIAELEIDENVFKFDENLSSKQIKLNLNQNYDLNSIQNALNDYFNLVNVFNNEQIGYYDELGNDLDGTNKFNYDKIKVKISKEIEGLVKYKNKIEINLNFKIGVNGKKFKESFSSNHFGKILKDNKYETIVSVIKGILRTEDESTFEIYDNYGNKIVKKEILDGQTYTVKIIKNIDFILKDKKNNEDKEEEIEDEPEEGVEEEKKGKEEIKNIGIIKNRGYSVYKRRQN